MPPPQFPYRTYLLGTQNVNCALGWKEKPEESQKPTAGANPLNLPIRFHLCPDLQGWFFSLRLRLFLETYRSLFLSKLLAIWSLPFTKLSSPAFWTTRSRWTQPTGGIYLSCSSNTRIWQQNWDFSCSICSHLGSFKHRLWERPRKGRGELKYLEGKSHLFDKLWTACQAGLIYWRNRR